MKIKTAVRLRPWNKSEIKKGLTKVYNQVENIVLNPA